LMSRQLSEVRNHLAPVRDLAFGQRRGGADKRPEHR
jgi:hypothetical protein